MTEGTVAKWLQPEGAHVQSGEPLYEVETDKVTLTVDAPESGVLERVVAEGETVPVGTVVGRLGAVAGQAAVAVPVEEVRASPAARAAARRLGIDLRKIANGRRLREADVLAHAPKPGGASISGRRKVIAERMRRSLAESAQLTISMEVGMTEALRLREQLKQLLSDEQRPTITDLVIRASVMALREHPSLNATFHDGELQPQERVHVGLAVDTEEGLIVPVLHGADGLALQAVAERTKELSRRARENLLGVDDVSGGTFTVTSLGPLGVDFFTPILNPPQVAILGVGRVFPRLLLSEGHPVERQFMYLNLSFDHQAVDGAPAARFLQAVKKHLELPASLLIA
jgi:pyruvate dehydrogenase E2 component (dihydrolipoamide acetyltransferase)